jgi:hypothetical protein
VGNYLLLFLKYFFFFFVCVWGSACYRKSHSTGIYTSVGTSAMSVPSTFSTWINIWKEIFFFHSLLSIIYKVIFNVIYRKIPWSSIWYKSNEIFLCVCLRVSSYRPNDECLSVLYKYKWKNIRWVEDIQVFIWSPRQHTAAVHISDSLASTSC